MWNQRNKSSRTFYCRVVDYSLDKNFGQGQFSFINLFFVQVVNFLYLIYDDNNNNDFSSLLNLFFVTNQLVS